MAGKQIVKMMSAKEVEKLSRIEGRHAVGGCPSLYIQRIGGSMSWVLRVLINGKRREIGLGPYPSVSLEEARAEGQKQRNQIRNGIDPVAEKRRQKLERKVAQAKAMTFAECVDAYLDAHEDSWKNPKHRQQWRNTLGGYANPIFGALPVGEVDTGLVVKALEPIWKDKTETATRLRGRIEQVLDWATVRGYRQGLNPARWKGHLDKLLPAKSKIAKADHFPALSYKEISAFILALRKREGIAALALEFAILTGARSEQVRGATWEEIDWDNALWIIPAQRMKMKREHRVPLAECAVKMLKIIPKIAGTNLVFPGRHGVMSDMTLGAVIKRMHETKLKEDGVGWIEATTGRTVVQHGFRSTFRDWASEVSHYPGEMAEMALAHVVANKVEAAYRRGDLLDKRRRMMEDWARYCSTVPQEDAKVLPFRKDGANTAA